MRRFLNLKHSKQPSREPQQSRPRPQRLRPRPDSPSPVSELPYEIVENILSFAWHGEITGLPGCGSFIFDAPRSRTQGANDSTNVNVVGTDAGAGSGEDGLLPNPHTKLTTSNEATRDSAGNFPSLDEYMRLSLVCSQWHEIMQDVVRTFVPLTSLRRFRAYAHLVGAELPTDQSTSSSQESGGEESQEDGVKKKGKGKGKEKDSASAAHAAAVAAAQKDAEDKARRLCQSIHIDIPTGNLSMVPSWSSILPILRRLDNLTHLMITAAEPHPAFFALLGSLPETITTLDIHISSPYVYKRPLLPILMGGSGVNSAGTAKLRGGLQKVKHLLINVLDPTLLECILEGFGSIDHHKPSSLGSSGAAAAAAAASAPPRASTVIYSSPSLQTLIIQGPHSLTSPTITNTVSHSHSIHTLKLYSRSNRNYYSSNHPHHPQTLTNGNYTFGATAAVLQSDPLKMWNAAEALRNKARFPALEALVVQLPQFEETTPALDQIRQICKERGVRVSVEWIPRV